MADRIDAPAPDLLSDEVLTAMERDGWTPGQVRALIASYRLLRREVEWYRERMVREPLDPDQLDLGKLEEEGEKLRAEVAERMRGMIGDD